jgi:acetylornithine deacetylase/succinyl-diaminopimelate desuccinylase-like protein
MRISTYSRRPLDLWESGPFALTHRDGRLYARGVADDKGNLFVLVEAVQQLAEEGTLPVNVRFAFDGEEEVEATRSSRGSTRMRGRRTSR